MRIVYLHVNWTLCIAVPVTLLFMLSSNENISLMTFMSFLSCVYYIQKVEHTVWTLCETVKCH